MKFKRGDIVQHNDGSIYLVTDVWPAPDERPILETIVELDPNYDGSCLVYRTGTAACLTKIGEADL